MERIDAERRRLAAGIAALVSAAALASCRSVLPETNGAGASMTARKHMQAIREAEGLEALSPDERLEKAALQQSGYMAVAGRMEHTALRGRDFVSRMKANGVPAPAAENLAHGRMDLDRLFRMWMESPPHRRNMLDGRFGRYGLAYVEDGNGLRYWTLVLGA